MAFLLSAGQEEKYIDLLRDIPADSDDDAAKSLIVDLILSTPDIKAPCSYQDSQTISLSEFCHFLLNA